MDGPGASPIDFPAAETGLKSKPQTLKDFGGTVIAPNAGFEFILDVASSPLAIFLIDSADFCSGCTVKFINVAANSTVVVNVKGINVASTNAAYFINGMAIDGDSSTPLASRILYNYFEATSLYMNSGLQGSVLAPYADKEAVDAGSFAILDLVRKSKRTVLAGALVTLALLPAPALLAPYVSDDPGAWAYRAYHPFMYRYPVVLGSHTKLDLATRSRPQQSLEVLRLMIRLW